MSENIKFEKDVLELLNQLTSIQTSVIIKKDENNSTWVKQANAGKTIAYILSATDESLQIDEEIAFYDYPEFYQLLKVFNSPDIIKQDNKFIIKEKNSKINYLLSQSEVLPNGPKVVHFNNNVATLKLSLNTLREIKKMINLVKAERVNIKMDENSDGITIKCYNSSHDNNWENVYQLEEQSTADINFTIESEVFTVIPDNDYMFDISKDGLVRFRFNTEHVNLEIFVAECEN